MISFPTAGSQNHLALLQEYSWTTNQMRHTDCSCPPAPVKSYSAHGTRYRIQATCNACPSIHTTNGALSLSLTSMALFWDPCCIWCLLQLVHDPYTAAPELRCTLHLQPPVQDPCCTWHTLQLAQIHKRVSLVPKWHHKSRPKEPECHLWQILTMKSLTSKNIYDKCLMTEWLEQVLSAARIIQDQLGKEYTIDPGLAKMGTTYSMDSGAGPACGGKSLPSLGLRSLAAIALSTWLRGWGGQVLQPHHPL